MGTNRKLLHVHVPAYHNRMAGELAQLHVYMLLYSSDCEESLDSQIFGGENCMEWFAFQSSVSKRGGAAISN